MKIYQFVIPKLAPVLLAILLLTGSAQPQAVQAGLSLAPAACSPVCNLFLPLINKPMAVQVSNIEFTQAIQSLNNDVSLVANRPTLARITFAATGGSAISGITAQLHALRGGVELGTSPVSNSTAFTAPVAPNRGSLGDTLNFWLPAAWTSAPVDLYLSVVSPGSLHYPSSGYVTLNFRTTPAMTIVIVPLQVTIGGVGHTPTVPANLTALTYQMYPLAQSPTIIPHGLMNGGSYATSLDMWNNILNVITNIHASEDSTTAYKEYFGVVNVDCNGGCISGIGWIPGSTNSAKSYFSAVGFDGAGFGGNAAGQTAAHEIGHTNGRYHAYCGASNNVYPPNATGKIDDWGFNIVTQALYNPATTYDFMSYCNSVWTSKYGYQSIFDFRGATLAAMAAQPTQETLAISGWLTGSQVKVSPPFSISAPITADDPQGEYQLEQRDGTNQLLYRVRFNLQATDSSAQGFLLNIPADARAQRIQLYHGTRLVFEQQASNDLRVAINTQQLAQNDPTALSWSANGALSYMVRASNDGGKTWQVLGMNLNAQQLKLDLQTLPGGDVIIEVQASDGVHAVKHQTQTHIGKHPPHASIAQTDLQNIKAGQPFHLIAIAHDAEDGALHGNAVRWSSDRDGVLGTGTTLWLERGLSTGAHTITLSATDSDGNTITDQSVIDVQ